MAKISPARLAWLEKKGRVSLENPQPNGDVSPGDCRLQTEPPLVILRRKKVEARTGLTRSPIYARIQAGTFPKPIRLGNGRAVGWIEAEIDAWIAAQIEKSRKA